MPRKRSLAYRGYSAAEGVHNFGSGHSETVRRTVERLRDMIDPGLPTGFGDAVLRNTLEWHGRKRN